MNAMIYIRGNRSDFDTWAKDGATGWSYDEVLPLFRRSEANSRGEGVYHGAGGPLHIEDPRSPNPLSQSLLDAMVATGIRRNDDFNGAEQVGAGFYQLTQKRGKRWTTADGYVTPARRRPNFTVLTDCHVLRVRTAGGRATGVEVERKGRVEFLAADREVVLSAGALHTPQLLMLSGIGPADHLAEHGIATVVDNAHVGAHLMDHPMVLMNWETTDRDNLAHAEKPGELLKYVTRRKGMLTSNVGEAGSFFHTSVDDIAPQMEMITAPVYFFQHGAASYDKTAIAIGLSMVGARSEGAVRLRSADPAAAPRICNNYFADPRDMQSMIDGIERAREVMASRTMRGTVGKEIHPGPSYGTSRTDLERAVRAEVEHTYHPSCTARIGVEGEGVLDASLRVQGVTGLRVADASAMPRVTHGNTHAPTMLIGEKAADLITSGA
jgi:choline dehydrogenase